MRDASAHIRTVFGLNGAHGVVEIPNVGRDYLGTLFRDLGFLRGAEVGVENGIFSETLCRANPGVEHFCIDPYVPYPNYSVTKNRNTFLDFQEQAWQRLRLFNCKFIEKFSMEAVQEFPPSSLDYVYIDANHTLRYVVEDVVEWAKRVRSGGIVAGHDWFYAKGVDVIYGVMAYVGAHKIDPLYLLGTRKHVEGQIRDKRRSWMFVKP